MKVKLRKQQVKRIKLRTRNYFIKLYKACFKGENIIVVFIIMLAIMVVPYWSNFFNITVSNNIDVGAIISFIVGLFVLRFLIKRSNIQEDIYFADLFNSGVSYLSSSKTSIALSGIELLHNLALNNTKYRERIFNIFVNYLRVERVLTTQKKLDKDKIMLKNRIVKYTLKQDNRYNLYKKFALDLNRARLQGVNLTEADLSGASLISAKLQGTYLQGANLEKADLFKANLKDTSLLETNFNKAFLIGADLQGANVLETIITSEQLARVKTLYQIKNLDASIQEKLENKKPILFVNPTKI